MQYEIVGKLLCLLMNSIHILLYIELHNTGRQYLRLFFHLLDAAVVNSWVQHSLDCNESGIQKPMSLFDFSAEIFNCLLRVGQKPSSVTKSRFYSMEGLAKNDHIHLVQKLLWCQKIFASIDFIIYPKSETDNDVKTCTAIKKLRFSAPSARNIYVWMLREIVFCRIILLKQFNHRAKVYIFEYSAWM